jgi:hypothetical protein
LKKLFNFVPKAKLIDTLLYVLSKKTWWSLVNKQFTVDKSLILIYR